MDGADSILDTIHEEVSLDDIEDVDMMDVEDGEVVEGQISQQTCVVDEIEVNEEQCKETSQPATNMSKSKKRRNKKKKKKEKGEPGSKGINVDKFVLDACKRLREKKSYLVYTAVGVLGVSAVSDLVKEVDAVQACGGQKTADGYRCRTGGGILWNILKVRDPNVFKEIMKKGKEFEKQFKRPMLVQPSKNSKNAPEKAENAITSKMSAGASDDNFEVEYPKEDQPLHPNTVEKRKSVHDRMRVPVSYDDLIGEEPIDDQPNSN